MNEIRKTDIIVPSKFSPMCLDTYLPGAKTFPRRTLDYSYKILWQPTGQQNVNSFN